MSDKDKRSSDSGFSIQDEIKKRKTQEIQRAVEHKRPDLAPNPLSQNKPASRTQTTSAVTSQPDDKRSTQLASRVPAARSTQTMPRSTQTMPPAKSAQARVTQTLPNANANAERFAPSAARTTMTGQRKRLTQAEIIGLAVLLMLMVCMVTGLLAYNVSRPNGDVTPTFESLPFVNAQDAVDRLQSVGVPMTNVLRIDFRSQQWHAYEGLRFSVQRGKDRADFLIFSYSNTRLANGDAFRARFDPKYRTWHSTTFSNILLLTAPKGSDTIRSEIENHMIHYLIAPYRPFLPTATPTTAPTTNAATKSGS
jgi:hypothetical protein